MKKCSKCGARNPYENHYCQKCGAPVSSDPNRPAYRMKEIPADESTIDWNYPLGEISFLNQGLFSQVIRTSTVRRKVDGRRIVLTNNEMRFSYFCGLALFLITYVLNLHFTLMRGTPISSGSWFLIVGISVFVGGLLLFIYQRKPLIVLDGELHKIEIFVGKNRRFLFSKEEIGRFFVRTMERSKEDNSGRTKKWNVWCLIFETQKGQILPLVELDDRKQSEALLDEIQSIFSDD